MFCTANSLDRIEEALVKADACGYTGREVQDAKIMKVELTRKREVSDSFCLYIYLPMNSLLGVCCTTLHCL
jgi:hypothetical protein